MAKRTKIVQSALPEEEVTAEVLASSIAELADAVKRFNSTRLNERALLLLISHNMSPKHRLSPAQIGHVLASMDSLATAYLKR